MNYGFVITKKGLNLITKLMIPIDLVITRIMVGNGRLPENPDPKNFTDLISPIALATSTVPVVNNRQLEFKVEYRNEFGTDLGKSGGLRTGFWLNEYGVFAQDPDDGEILLYYATLGDYPQWVQPFAPGMTDVRRYPVAIGLNSDANVRLEYPSVAFLTAEDLSEHNLCETAHENRFSDLLAQMNARAGQTMPLAPTGGQHTATGGRWNRLSDELTTRAVVLVSEDVPATFDGTHIRIPPGDFERLDVFRVSFAGARARIEKDPPRQTHHAVGEDFEHYAFDYDAEEMRIGVRRLGIAAGNRNLLINGDFRNPVNQQGLLEYTNTANAGRYSIDMWLARQSVRVNVLPGKGIAVTGAGGDTITRLFTQFIENGAILEGETVTMSVEMGGEIHSATLKVPGVDGPSPSIAGLPNPAIVAFPDLNLRLILAQSGEHLAFSVHVPPQETVEISRVKLELGPVSTLANDPPPDFGTELLKCQRYQVIWGPQGYRLRASNAISNMFNVFVPTPVNMRTCPVLTGTPTVHPFNGTIELPYESISLMHRENFIWMVFSRQNHNAADVWVNLNGCAFDANL